MRDKQTLFFTSGGGQRYLSGSTLEFCPEDKLRDHEDRIVTSRWSWWQLAPLRLGVLRLMRPWSTWWLSGVGATPRLITFVGQPRDAQHWDVQLYVPRWPLLRIPYPKRCGWEICRLRDLTTEDMLTLLADCSTPLDAFLCRVVREPSFLAFCRAPEMPTPDFVDLQADLLDWKRRYYREPVALPAAKGGPYR